MQFLKVKDVCHRLLCSVPCGMCSLPDSSTVCGNTPGISCHEIGNFGSKNDGHLVLLKIVGHLDFPKMSASLNGLQPFWFLSALINLMLVQSVLSGTRAPFRDCENNSCEIES